VEVNSIESYITNNDSPFLNIEAVCSSETSANFSRTTWHHIAENSNRTFKITAVGTSGFTFVMSLL
jgi:hypothetical protein